MRTQSRIITQMTRDLNLDSEDCRLPLSCASRTASRNVFSQWYLNAEERNAAAGAESRALARQKGRRRRVRASLHSANGVAPRARRRKISEVAYVGIVDAATFEPGHAFQQPCFVVLRFSSENRLNCNLYIEPKEPSSDRWCFTSAVAVGLVHFRPFLYC